MQVVMNKCFLLNPEKKFGANPSWRFRENEALILKNDVTEPKARLLLITSQFQASGNHSFRKS